MTLPSPFTLIASVTASSGTTITKVEFYNGATFLGSSTAVTSPHTYTWSNVPAGTYTITVKATDNLNAVTTSAPITLISNALPTVSLTAPASGATFTAPASITLTATATDSDGTISKVDFYNGTTLLGTATSAPYSYTWNNVSAGSYTLTAKATDNRGAVATSSGVSVTVGTGSGPRLYYLHTDALNTPRLVTDETNKVVWRNNPLSEPFGLAPPEEDPDGDTIPFTLNLRFPGQVADKETNLNYNYFRDYNPNTGRYIESDPIGLAGGQLSTYAYVDSNPLQNIDPSGLMGQGAGRGVYPPGQGPGSGAITNNASDFLQGAASYYGGLWNATKHAWRRGGLSGECEKQRAIEEEAILAAGLLSLSDPDIASKALSGLGDWADNHKTYMAGRMSAGAVTGALSRTGVYGGASLTLTAGMGDALGNIRNGADNPSQILGGVLGQQIPAGVRNMRTRCECSR